jgi:putative RecB family exonuclease
MTIEELKTAPHLSFSQISTYLMCPLKYCFTYVEKVPFTFTPISLAFGSGMHKVVEQYYRAHIEGETLPADTMSEKFKRYWLTEKDKREIDFNGGSEEETLTMAEKLIGVFCEKVSPMQVLGVERPFSVTLGEDLPPLIGAIDLIESDWTGNIAIVDLKTAGKRKSDAELSADLQMTAYSLGIKTIGYHDDVLLRFDLLLKQKKPDLIKQYTLRSEHDRQRLVKLVKAVWSAIQKEAFFPSSNFTCPTCPYKAPCKDW